LMGFPHSPPDISCHLAAIHVWDQKPDKALVVAARKWFDTLKAWNRDTGFCPPAVFNQRLEAQWHDLFFRLPRHGVAPAWAHLSLTRTWPMDHLAYLAKYTVNRWMGRAPRKREGRTA
jgi:hypothetical protein